MYDTLDRTSSITLKNGNVNIITKTFTYVNGTNLIENEEFSNNSTNNNGIDYSYVYDSLNRLTEVRENGTIKSRYTYDDMGKLIREDNAYANKSYVYEYTANGNISAKKTYAYTAGTLGTVQKTESRTYGNTDWTDQLTKINGTTITYDGMGNPLNWRNASLLDWDGRRLKSFTKTDGTVITYTYDENGLRTSKTVGTDRIDYVYDGSRLIEEKHAGYTLKFLYDESSTLIGFNYSTSSFSGNFYYGIDNFGNIKYIYDSTGEIITTYRYDAWGRLISSSGYQSERFGKWNPFRYKGYYYDAETELYYLQSRYYDASMGRFVNADEPMLLGTSGGVYAYNLYAYCENDPVNNIDFTGEFLISTAVLIGIGIGALIGGAVGGIYGNYKANKSGIQGWEKAGYIFGYGLGGAIVGGIIGGFVGYGAGFALGGEASSGVVVKSISKALSSVSKNTINHIMQSKHAWGTVLKNATWKNVQGLINTTIQKGATTLINKQGGALVYEAVKNNVVVRYAVIDGIIKITDAWVKTR